MSKVKCISPKVVRKEPNVTCDFCLMDKPESKVISTATPLVEGAPSPTICHDCVEEANKAAATIPDC